NICPAGFLQYKLSDRSSRWLRDGNVPIVRNPAFEILQCGRTWSVRSIVNDNKLYLVYDFGMVKADRLQSEIDTIVIVISSHADGELLNLFAWCRRWNGGFDIGQG